MIDISPVSLIVTVINILVFAWIMKKFLFKRVMDVIDKRENLIKSRFDEAATEKQKAEETRQEYEGKIESAHVEAKAILDSARGQAAKEREHILNEAREESKSIKARAKSDIEAEKVQAKADLQTDITNLAMAAAKKILEGTEESGKA